MYGREQKPVRWKVCLHKSQNTLGLAVGALYAQRYFNDKDKYEAIEMVKNLKQTFVEIIQDLDWMDLDTKNAAVEKVSTVILGNQ